MADALANAAFMSKPEADAAYQPKGNYLTEHQDISGKQDVISDLAAIREGAALGKTALQLESDPTVPAWAKQPEKPSYTAAEVGALPAGTAYQTPLTADVDYLTPSTAVNTYQPKGTYLTEHQSLEGYAKISDIPAVPTVPTNVSAFENDAGYLTQHQDISGKQDVISDLETIRDGAAKGATALQSVPMGSVSTIGGAMFDPNYGITINEEGKAYLHQNNIWVTNRAQSRPVTTAMLDYAVKSALADGKGAAYTDEEKTAACERIGALQSVPNVTKDGEYGLVKTNEIYGITWDTTGNCLRCYPADTGWITARNHPYAPIGPKNLDYAVKAALCDGKGAAYTETEKRAAQNRLGIVTITQEDYDLLDIKDESTIYLIVG